MSVFPSGELQWAAKEMPNAMARIEIQNVHAFQSVKASPTTYRDTVLLEELGMRAYQFLETPGPDECEHGRLLTDDCDDCERY